MRSRSEENDKTIHRADAARTRRTQRSQKRVSMVSERVIHPRDNQPVTVRGNAFGTPIHRTAGKNRARRQFYLAMDQAGAELRLPAIALANPGWRLLSALLAILALVGIFSMWNSTFFRISAIEVNGLQRLNPADLTAALNLENLSIVQVDRQAVLALLVKAYPDLAEIKVAVFMPNVVTVSAVERQPVLAWKKGDQVQWVDAEGFIFPARGDAGPLVTVTSENDLPLAARPAAQLPVAEPGESSQPEEEAQPGLLERITGVGKPSADSADELPLKANPVLITAAQELSRLLPPETAIVYDSRNGLGWEDSHGWQVYIGKDLSDYEAKYATYEKIVSHLVEQGLQPTLVSVEHLNAPFYRLEQ